MTEPVGDRPLRIAFAGPGMISAFHLAGWKETPTVKVVSVCDPVHGLRTGAFSHRSPR